MPPDGQLQQPIPADAEAVAAQRSVGGDSIFSRTAFCVAACSVQSMQLKRCSCQCRVLRVFWLIHQAQKLICRKCKRHVTELSGRVVCEGTRRYRLCNDCLLETGCDTPGSANHSAAEPCFEDDEGLSWPMTDEDELAEDSGADLIIQEVEDSDEEMDRKEVKPFIG
ncbi:UNVERIFIED_CONTAM: hypothetical protein FKN15_002850 [Acipenser sinensis]